MKLINTIIFWNKKDPLLVVVFDRNKGVSIDFQHWSNDWAFYPQWRELTDDERILQMFVMFNKLVVMEQIPTEILHHRLLVIDEYRERLEGI